MITIAAAIVVPAAGSTGTRPSLFAAGVDNPFFPLRPGTTYVYRGTEEGKPSRDVVTVTRQTRTIQAVRCTVVSDRLYLARRLREQTADWYAQDAHGNVWYFGEATAEFNSKGRVTSREGSWEAGRDGAKAGIVMPAHPQVGQAWQQEYYKGHAEDRFRVLSVSAVVRTPAAASRRAVLTKEWTPLEPRVVDHKYYVRGVGLVKEQSVRGPAERAVLVSVRR